jgi:hypothetical protein
MNAHLLLMFRREKLIDAIHSLQIARLSTAYFSEESTNLVQLLEVLFVYLGAAGTGPDADKATATYVRERRIYSVPPSV